MSQSVESRLGCSTITFRQLPLFHALERIRSAALTKVDIACIPGWCEHVNPLQISAQEREELVRRINALGLRISTLNVAPRQLNSDRQTDAFEYMAAAIDLAAEFGCYAITIPPGGKVPEDQWQENAELTARLIRELADHAEEKGVTLTLESPHVGTLAESVSDGARYFRVLDEKRVLCTFDCSHAQRGNPNPVTRSVVEVGAPIGHVHLRDCIGENNSLTPGRGHVDFAGLLSMLDQLGYRGDLILELEGEEETVEETEAELRFARHHILGLLK